ncbi:MAG: PilZ domain-containing protein [Terriglobales bacterium]
MPTNTNIDDATKRRRCHRFQFTAPLRLRIEKAQDGTLTDTRGCQMNDGGIAIYANAELSIGTQVEIEFTPPSFDFPLTLRGVVRNRTGNQYGVEFLETSAAEKEHLVLFGEILRSKAGCFDA